MKSAQIPQPTNKTKSKGMITFVIFSTNSVIPNERRTTVTSIRTPE